MNPSPASVRLRAPGEPRVLGVLGGMGPLATARFYDAVVRATPAGHDQGHIPTVIWSDPRIPDRTAAILAGGPSPVPAMVDGARKLETAGAEILAIPCNTAHAFLPELRASTRLVWIDMVGETLDLVARSGAERVGVLGTRGTRAAALYDAAASRRGLRVMYPSDCDQSRLIDEAIGLVKSGRRLSLAEDRVASAASRLHRGGADVLVAACTELPLVLGPASLLTTVVDSLECLASACVRACLTYVAGGDSDRDDEEVASAIL
ncbi:aspartate/glutamate racemase family protein [Microbacterium maritypicum]|uniref:Aspartate/glutamate racemase family protein n=1 Tax=Microbacterium maritypicum TaxID=33918 RepID=A0AAD3ZXI3_MICMQ|nr:MULTISPECIES: amino acid racemase [Microbacterium]KAB1881390.1 aspartate/glutamate racemase family protein [Microbacterium liquefaciens]